MKNYLAFAAVAVLAVMIVSADAHAVAYIKFDGVDGEVSTSTSIKVSTQVATTTAPRAIPQVIYSDTLVPSPAAESKGNVEFEWKVEEGEKSEPSDPDFGILLGGGGGGSADEEERNRGLERARQVIEENAKASDQAIESISLNFEKITTRVRHEVRLFGFIPVTATTDVDIDAEERVKVRFPWWSFLASGTDEEALGARIYTTLSNVLKTKHDTVKNSINNVR